MLSVCHLAKKLQQRSNEVCSDVWPRRKRGSLSRLDSPYPVLRSAFDFLSSEYWTTTDAKHGWKFVGWNHFEVATKRMRGEFRRALVEGLQQRAYRFNLDLLTGQLRTMIRYAADEKQIWLNVIVRPSALVKRDYSVCDQLRRFQVTQNQEAVVHEITVQWNSGKGCVIVKRDRVQILGCYGNCIYQPCLLN